MQVHNVYNYQKYTTDYSDCNWTITVSVIWQLLVADFSSVGDYNALCFIIYVDKQLEIVRFHIGCSNVDLVTKS